MVRISLSAAANSSNYYALRRAALDKLQRTGAAEEKALRSAEARIRADLASHRAARQTRVHLAARRKTL